MHVRCRQELEVLEGAMEEARAHARSAEHRASVLGKELEVSCIHSQGTCLKLDTLRLITCCSNIFCKT